MLWDAGFSVLSVEQVNSRRTCQYLSPLSASRLHSAIHSNSPTVSSPGGLFDITLFCVTCYRRQSRPFFLYYRPKSEAVWQALFRHQWICLQFNSEARGILWMYGQSGQKARGFWVKCWTHPFGSKICELSSCLKIFVWPRQCHSTNWSWTLRCFWSVRTICRISRTFQRSSCTLLDSLKRQQKHSWTQDLPSSQPSEPSSLNLGDTNRSSLSCVGTWFAPGMMTSHAAATLVMTLVVWLVSQRCRQQRSRRRCPSRIHFRRSRWSRQRKEDDSAAQWFFTWTPLHLDLLRKRFTLLQTSSAFQVGINDLFRVNRRTSWTKLDKTGQTFLSILLELTFLSWSIVALKRKYNKREVLILKSIWKKNESLVFVWTGENFFSQPWWCDDTRWNEV